MSDEYRNAQSRMLVDRITGSDLYKSASCVLAYASMPTEICVGGVIARAIVDGKSVCVPRVDWAQSTMECALIPNLDEDLQIGRYGLRSPIKRCQTVPDHQIDLALIPGLGFDDQCHRLGRGGGFYDRWIGSHSKELRRNSSPVMLVGVGFDGQIVPAVPMDGHDQPLDRVVTPTARFAARK